MARQPENAPQRRRLIFRISSRRDVETGLPLALDLAAALRTEIEAVFVEEEAPLAASRLPFPTVIGFAGNPVTVDAEALEAAIRREAEACHRLLTGAAERMRRAIAFQRMRGEAIRLLSEASGAGDILALKVDRFGTPIAAMIDLARRLAPPGGGVLLLPEQGTPGRGPVVELRQAGESAPSLDEIARQLAEALETRLAHLDVDGDPTADAALRAARLVVARLESPALERRDLIRRLVLGLRAPLLVMRTGPDDGH